MRKTFVLLSAILFGLSAQCHALSWTIDYGTPKDKGKVSVYNNITAPDFAEDAPYGPMSFRVIKEDLWLLDSVSGRLLSFNKDGKAIKQIDIPNLNEFKLIEDFAFSHDQSGVWVANAEDRTVKKISLSGEQLLEIDGNKIPGGNFVQVNQLETDSKGNLYIGDCGLARLLIFNSNGVLLREMPWQNSGFAIDSQNRLHIIEYSETAGYFHNIYLPNGQIGISKFIGLKEHTNPRLWSVTNDNIYVSFIPAGGFRGIIKLYEINNNSLITRVQDIVPQGNMNRYIEIGAKNIFFPVANFFTAPKGNFAIKEIEWAEYKYEEAYSSAAEITKEYLVKIPADIAENGLLGMRTAGERVVVANKSGKYIVFNLKTGETFTGAHQTNSGLLDFDTVVGKIIYIDENGKLGGHVMSFWPKSAFKASKIEAYDEGLLLTGGEKAYFLSKNSAQINEIEGMRFAQPVLRGFVWTLKTTEKGNWRADLTDSFGNIMGEVYTFSKDFDPVNIEVGPEGIEGELVLSAYENGIRKLMFIGNNGRMFWKIDAPEKISPRDVGFDHNSELLFIEKHEGETWISRWKMVTPEG